jgi:hypothetical protein
MCSYSWTKTWCVCVCVRACVRACVCVCVTHNYMKLLGNCKGVDGNLSGVRGKNMDEAWRLERC